MSRSTRDFERRVAVEQRARRRAALRQPVQSEERRTRHGLGDALGQSCLATAERTDDVVQRADGLQLKTVRLPQGHGRSNATLKAGGRVHQAPREFAGSRRPPAGEVEPAGGGLFRRRRRVVERDLRARPGAQQAPVQDPRGIASQHARHLAEAEAEFAQGRDLGDAGHLIGTIGAPAGRGAGSVAIRPRCS